MNKFYLFTSTCGDQFLINGSRIVEVLSHIDLEITTINYLTCDGSRSFEVDMTVDEVFEYLKQS